MEDWALMGWRVWAAEEVAVEAGGGWVWGRYFDCRPAALVAWAAWAVVVMGRAGAVEVRIADGLFAVG